MSCPKHISASSIAAFKACPTRYRLAYVEGLRPIEEAPPLRMGSAWHRGLEILETPSGTKVLMREGIHGTINPKNRLAIAVSLACEVYATVPDWADIAEWAVEREIVANGLAGYHWYHGNLEDSEYETVGTELPFTLPLVNPETGGVTPKFERVGIIDRLVRHVPTGKLLVQENKTTSKSIDSGSTYWGRLRKDTQSKFYIIAARDLQIRNFRELDKHVHGTTVQDRSLVSGLLHDVFHKPAIRPRKLTMADSKKFVATGEYCDQKFNIENCRADGEITASVCIRVDEVFPEIELGKKEGTFTIRETPSMYGARLLQDIISRPEYYFVRREIAFTDKELLSFNYQVWALQRNMAEMERTGFWFDNEGQCEATFRCQYLPICYNNVECCDGKTEPPGFRRRKAKDVVQIPDTGGE